MQENLPKAAENHENVDEILVALLLKGQDAFGQYERPVRILRGPVPVVGTVEA